MKLLIFLALFLPIATFGQKKYTGPPKWPTPYRDSVRDEFTSDTLWGMVEMPVTGGIIRARGFMETHADRTYRIFLYSKEQQVKIEQIKTATQYYPPYGEVIDWPIYFDIYYMTEKGPRRPEVKYIFIPNDKP